MAEPGPLDTILETIEPVLGYPFRGLSQLNPRNIKRDPNASAVLSDINQGMVNYGPLGLAYKAAEGIGSGYESIKTALAQTNAERDKAQKLGTPEGGIGTLDETLAAMKEKYGTGKEYKLPKTSVAVPDLPRAPEQPMPAPMSPELFKILEEQRALSGQTTEVDADAIMQEQVFAGLGAGLKNAMALPNGEQTVGRILMELGTASFGASQDGRREIRKAEENKTESLRKQRLAHLGNEADYIRNAEDYKARSAQVKHENAMNAWKQDMEIIKSTMGTMKINSNGTVISTTFERDENGQLMRVEQLLDENGVMAAAQRSRELKELVGTPYEGQFLNGQLGARQEAAERAAAYDITGATWLSGKALEDYQTAMQAHSVDLERSGLTGKLKMKSMRARGATYLRNMGITLEQSKDPGEKSQAVRYWQNLTGIQVKPKTDEAGYM